MKVYVKKSAVKKLIREMLKGNVTLTNAKLTLGGEDLPVEPKKRKIGEAKAGSTSMVTTYDTALAGRSAEDAEQNLKRIAKAIGLGVPGTRRAVEAALDKMRFTGAEIDFDEALEIVAQAHKDYMEVLKSSGELSDEDIKFLEAHPEHVQSSPYFRTGYRKEMEYPEAGASSKKPVLEPEDVSGIKPGEITATGAGAEYDPKQQKNVPTYSHERKGFWKDPKTGKPIWPGLQKYYEMAAAELNREQKPGSITLGED